MKVISLAGVVLASALGLMLGGPVPRPMSIVEWILFAVLIYSAVSLFKILWELQTGND